MKVLDIQKKITPVLPKGERSLYRFFKEALILKLQEVNQKIAVFEGKYNKGFREFVRDWTKRKNAKRYAYELESDYLDWEALEQYKRDLMRVIHSL